MSILLFFVDFVRWLLSVRSKSVFDSKSRSNVNVDERQVNGREVTSHYSKLTSEWFVVSVSGVLCAHVWEREKEREKPSSPHCGRSRLPVGRPTLMLRCAHAKVTFWTIVRYGQRPLTVLHSVPLGGAHKWPASLVTINERHDNPLYTLLFSSPLIFLSLSFLFILSLPNIICPNQPLMCIKCIDNGTCSMERPNSIEDEGGVQFDVQFCS